MQLLSDVCHKLQTIQLNFVQVLKIINYQVLFCAYTAIFSFSFGSDKYEMLFLGGLHQI